MDFKPSWLLLLLVLTCLLAFSVKIRVDQYKAWQEEPQTYFAGDIPMMTTLDAYYWLRLAREYRAGTIDKTLYPDLTQTPLLSLMLAKLSPLFDDNLHKTGIFLTLALPGLFVIPLFLYFYRIGAPSAGILGSLIGSSSLMYLARTGAGRVDTDLLNLFFPLLASLFIFRTNNKDRKYTYIFSALAGLTLLVFYWWYDKAGFTTIYFFVLTGYLIAHKTDKKTVFYSALIYIIIANPIHLWEGLAQIISFLKYYVVGIAEAGDLVFPKAVKTISEAGHMPFKALMSSLLRPGILSLTGLGLFVVFAMLHWKPLIPLAPIFFLGALAFIGSNRMAMYLAPFVGIGYGFMLKAAFNKIFVTIQKYQQDSNSPLEKGQQPPLSPFSKGELQSKGPCGIPKRAPSSPFSKGELQTSDISQDVSATPLSLLTKGELQEGAPKYSPLTKGDRGGCYKKTSAFLVLLLSYKPITLLTKGQQPPLSPFSKGQQPPLSPFSKGELQTGSDSLLRQGALYVLSFLLFFVITIKTPISFITPPAVSAEVYKAFMDLKGSLPKGSTIVTWWDSGYAIQEATGFTTVLDGGGSQNSVKANLIAHGIISDSQMELYNIAGLATEREEEINRLVNNAGTHSELIAALRGYNNQSEPEKDRSYLLFTEDMVGVKGVEKFRGIKFLGEWGEEAESGKTEGFGTTLLNCQTSGKDNNLLKCNDYVIDTAAGMINGGIPLREFVMVSDGYILARKTYKHNEGLYLEILGHKTDTAFNIFVVKLLSEKVYKTNLNRMFLLGNYDKDLFEEVYNAFPYARLFKIM